MESKFTGGLLGLIGISILQFLLIFITLGLGGPWAICMKERWIAEHTIIDGHRLMFDGKGIQLLGNYIKWALLTIITLGIYGFWFSINMKKWVVKHTHQIVNMEAPVNFAPVQPEETAKPAEIAQSAEETQPAESVDAE